MTSTQPIIHVVDDDPSFLKAVSRLLRAGGYVVKNFPSAAEFLNYRAPDSPGCILLDLSMPEQTGLDLQATLSAADNQLPIVFLTGHGDIPSTVDAMRHGAEDFLTKPVKKQSLFDAVKRALARNAREREQRAHLRALGRLLRAAGFEPTMYPSAEAFLRDAPRACVDCLVVDIHLGGMSGFDLQKTLAAGGSSPPVIFITGHEESETPELARRVGCVAFLRKPFPGNSLLEAIRRAVGAEPTS